MREVEPSVAVDHWPAEPDDVDAPEKERLKAIQTLAGLRGGNAKRGEGVYKQVCSACHQIGDGAKNRVGPILTGIVDALTCTGYEVLQADNGDDGMRMAVRGGYDLLLLDLVLPGPGGLEILAEVRTSRPTIPVIILTALGDESDRVKGLKDAARIDKLDPLPTRVQRPLA